MKTINLTPINIINVKIGAASALLNINDRIFTCCDDQYTLFELKNETWQEHLWENAPILPLEHKALKKVKPDFEVLIAPSSQNSQTITLIPSGSKKNRTLALRFNLKNHNFETWDMSEFFLKLSEKINSINIEGAVVFNNEIIFMNRGVQDQPSALIRANSETLEVSSVKELHFGDLDQVSLHGSELCIFENFLYSLLVAENTSNSYDDGKIMGSALCKISLTDFSIQEQWRFDLPIKAEGLCRYKNQWLLSTDSDGLGPSEFFTFTI